MSWVLQGGNVDIMDVNIWANAVLLESIHLMNMNRNPPARY